MFLLEEKRGLRNNFVTHSNFKITTGYAVVLGHERVNYNAL
jgi:glycyl-tRNA synthetase beta subunit